MTLDAILCFSPFSRDTASQSSPATLQLPQRTQQRTPHLPPTPIYRPVSVHPKWRGVIGIGKEWIPNISLGITPNLTSFHIHARLLVNDQLSLCFVF
ncbi:hypothetical protein AVEN_100741-1 [Araneus ventricosus]|uniref:Uncharacterized protein n=1 Tax=Araneus ventricosus TaxID=182803 RepID=A0A4Y2CTV4_ARAVE|nr:hypothetical protein AVEN_100741-1 [Araneus ventricosus]